jgi:hypothetical protein
MENAASSSDAGSMEKPSLTAEDYESIRDASDALHARGWRDAFSLNGQLRAWEDLIGLVEGRHGGYTLTVDDYTNDLAVRKWLEDIRSFLSPRVREYLDTRMRPLDARFREATVAPAQRLPGVSASLWWSRLPRDLRGELREDALRLGLRPG